MSIMAQSKPKARAVPKPQGECVLVIDNREKHVTRHLNELTGIQHVIQTITTGDYAILGPRGNIMVIIERKSLQDFASSLVDGRHQNKEKLKQLRDETGCQAIYLVEGPDEDPYCLIKKTRTPYHHVESAMFHIMVRDGIPIVRTKDTLDTAKMLVRFTRSMTTLDAKTKVSPEEPVVPVVTPVNEETINGSAEKSMSLLTRKHTRTTHEIAREMWSCFRGVAITTADEFINQLSLKELFTNKNTLSELSEFKQSNGKKLSKKVLSALSSPDLGLETRILACVPGISKITAKDILESARLSRLLTYDVGAMSIIKVGKDRKNLGESKAKNIIECFNYKFVEKIDIEFDPLEEETSADELDI